MGVKKLLIVTGEASGDLHGANLIRELKTLVPDLKVFGIGGEKLKQVGIEPLYNVQNIAVVGFWEIVPKFFHIRRALKLLSQRMITEHPDLCLLIDYPGFNLRVAKLAKKHRIKVVYYILPQIWAWGKWRIDSIYRWVDSAISILPFEAQFYKHIPVRFVGHPLLDENQKSTPNQVASRDKVQDKNQKPKTIALLPGSRRDEIKRILPIMLKCADKIPEFEFVIPVAPGIDKNWVEKLVCRGFNFASKIKIVENNAYEVLRNSELALIASGTATLEACILEVPSIIIYRLSLFSYILGRLLIKLPYIGLPNIIAAKEVMPEFIQFDAKPTKIVPAIQQILTDKTRAVSDLREVKKKLGSSGVTHRVAQILCESLRN